jgi:hypothetical protein
MRTRVHQLDASCVPCLSQYSPLLPDVLVMTAGADHLSVVAALIAVDPSHHRRQLASKWCFRQAEQLSLI